MLEINPLSPWQVGQMDSGLGVSWSPRLLHLPVVPADSAFPSCLLSVMTPAPFLPGAWNTWWLWSWSNHSNDGGSGSILDVLGLGWSYHCWGQSYCVLCVLGQNGAEAMTDTKWQRLQRTDGVGAWLKLWLWLWPQSWVGTRVKAVAAACPLYGSPEQGAFSPMLKRGKIFTLDSSKYDRSSLYL